MIVSAASAAAVVFSDEALFKVGLESEARAAVARVARVAGTDSARKMRWSGAQ
jgi:hypothetical protein